MGLSGFANGLTEIVASAIVEGFTPGSPLANGAICLRFIATTGSSYSLPAGLTNTVASADQAATGSSVFTVKVNTVSKGTFTVNAGQTTISSVSFVNTIIINGGDVIEITGPGTADATLGNITIGLFMTRLG